MAKRSKPLPSVLVQTINSEIPIRPYSVVHTGEDLRGSEELSWVSEYLYTMWWYYWCGQPHLNRQFSVNVYTVMSRWCGGGDSDPNLPVHISCNPVGK
jgi:hypothetical protein